MLTQNARLFFGTLRENMQLGAPHATDAEIVDALRQAGAWSFVRRLPMGMDYPVMEGGLGMTRGPRQGRLLARMLMREPTEMVLDELTAMFDAEIERGRV